MKAKKKQTLIGKYGIFVCFSSAHFSLTIWIEPISKLKEELSNSINYVKLIESSEFKKSVFFLLFTPSQFTHTQLSPPPTTSYTTLRRRKKEMLTYSETKIFSHFHELSNFLPYTFVSLLYTRKTAQQNIFHFRYD